ncbi:aminotransferase class IV [Desulfovibrio sp. OttesenSCG-928-C14]|nr:aminotransferase class IV [Desulfovibrio sp. OttesenSCG-928-C14]
MTVPPLLSTEEYLKVLLGKERPGSSEVLLFYDYRLGVATSDPRLMLLPLDDHLVHRADGVFEVMKYLDRHIYQLDQHLERMQKSAAATRLEPPCSWDDLGLLILQLASQAADRGGPDGIIRVFLGRGPGGFGVDPKESPASSLYIVVSRFKPKPESWYQKGLKAFRTSVPPRPEQFAHIKNTNYLTAVLMTLEGHDRGADVPINFDRNGYLAESAVANICVVDRAGRLLAPMFTHALPGTTILRAMELLKGKVECDIRRVPEADLRRGAEVLLLGTSPDCASIVEYEGQPIGEGEPGPVAALLRELIRQDITTNGTAF